MIKISNKKAKYITGTYVSGRHFSRKNKHFFFFLSSETFYPVDYSVSIQSKKQGNNEVHGLSQDSDPGNEGVSLFAELKYYGYLSTFMCCYNIVRH